MLIFDEQNKTVILNSIHDPIVSDSYWVFDAILMDFKLSKLTALEEITTPAVEVQVAGFKFLIPTKWSVLIADQETTQLDCVEAMNLAAKDFTVLSYGPKALTAQLPIINVVNYFPQCKVVAPILGKNCMLCHPVAPGYWINISPSEIYNKHLKNALIGDII